MRWRTGDGPGPGKGWTLFRWTQSIPPSSSAFRAARLGRGQTRLIITASGGPFLAGPGTSLGVTKEQALKHPNWTMGAKITIDSATLMNKGLEFIEAMRLYQMPPEKIQMVVHRQSIIHSLVEYCDNAILAQIGTADMRLPIQYALTWPSGPRPASRELDLFSCPNLTFERRT